MTMESLATRELEELTTSTRLQAFDMPGEGDDMRALTDEEKEAAWCREGAELGFAAAQYDLGALYVDGKGVPRDERQAAKWFRLAAAQGDLGAQHALDALAGKQTSAA